MPKEHKVRNSLKQTHHLLSKIRNSACVSSDSDSSESTDSGDLAHIPIKNIPSLEILSLNDNNNMEEVNAKLQTMMQMMEALAKQQTEHATYFSQIQTQTNQTQENVIAHQPVSNIDQLFKIPDPIKMIPIFDGNRKQLSSWLETAEETLNVLKPHVSAQQFRMYFTAVSNKVQGKAKDILCLAGNPDKFEDLKEILTNALGDRHELSTYKSQLWHCKMTEDMSIHIYYKKSKEIIQNIKTLAKQKDTYKNHWDAINEFIEEDALAAFISGLSEPYFGYAQAARPKDIEDAYAFLCKFKSKQVVARNLNQDQKFNKNKIFENKSQGSSNFNQNKKPFIKTEHKDTTEPMDTKTTRSRLTINNHVTEEEETQSHLNSETESDEEVDLDLNFHLVNPTQKTT